MRQKTRKVVEDPVVQEVREIRARLWRQAGGTVEGLTKLFDEMGIPVSKPKRRSRPRTKK